MQWKTSGDSFSYRIATQIYMAGTSNEACHTYLGNERAIIFKYIINTIVDLFLVNCLS